MESIEAIKPHQLNRVIDVVDAAGVDVSAWRASGNPSNPSYCYEWAFAQPGYSLVMLCLWYDECEIDSKGILHAGTTWPLIKRLEAHKATTAPRARRFDDILQQAWFHKSKIRVAIVDKSERQKAKFVDGDTNHADFRELDPVPWRLVSYDHGTGSYELRRGAAEAVQSPSESSLASTSVPAQEGALESYRQDESGDDHRALELADDLAEIVKRTDISATTRETLVKARVGQGLFRKRLIERWGGQCAVTGCSNLAVLRASHIKPWRDCDDDDRLNADNGLLLTANLDALFDVGLIAFHGDGTLWTSPKLSNPQRDELGLGSGLRVPVQASLERYLQIHRELAIAASVGKN